MTRAYVREQLRAQAITIMESLGFAWFESINQATQSKTLPAKWATMEFSISDDVRAALGKPTLMRENGTASVQIFTEQQTTDAVATQAADALRDAFTNWADTTGQLRINDCAPAVDLDSGDFRGAFYGVFVSVRYQYDRFVN